MEERYEKEKINEEELIDRQIEKLCPQRRKIVLKMAKKADERYLASSKAGAENGKF